MNIAFFWTWEFSKNILKKILEYNEINVKLIVSQEDKEIWRNKILTKTPVKILAEENNLKILQPSKLKNNLELFKQLSNLDFIVVVAYWKIVPKEVLDAPKYWCVNIHWSILPKYRWASPIQESIKNWDKETWLTIMYMNEAMDEWDILKTQKIKIDFTDKTSDIFKKFENFWAELLINTLKEIINWKITPIKQNNSKASYCSKITKQDWEINFKLENAEDIYNKFRAYYTWPWIYTYYNWKKLNIEECYFSNSLDIEKNNNFDITPWRVVKIDKNNVWIVCFDKKILILKQIKLEWKKTMDINTFINWNKDFLNYIF